MTILKMVLTGVTLLALITCSTLSAAAVIITESYSDPSYQQRSSSDQSYSPKPLLQGNYYSRNYRPQKRPQTSLLPAKYRQSPAEMLELSIKKVLAYLSRPQDDSLEQISFFLKQEITPHFDFKYMARWVAGRYYRTMSPQQRQQFTETFSQLFITTFVQKLSNYQNYPPIVNNFRSKRTSDNEALASASILQENGGSIRVDFKFLKTRNGWKVVDVKANGISALLYYRNFFSEQIRNRNQQQAVFK